MHYLRGYQQNYSQDKDIGLFTFYRQQAQYDSLRGTNQGVNQRKFMSRNNQAITRKVGRRISTLESDRPRLVSTEREDKIESRDRMDVQLKLKLIEEGKEDEQGESKDEKIFTNRQYLSLHKRHKKLLTDCPESSERKQIFFSPRSKLPQSQQKHMKNLSQQLSTQQQTPSKKHLPALVHPKIKYRQDNKQLLGRDGEKCLKFYKFDHLRDARSKASIRDKTTQGEDSKACSTFIMISSRQYKMLSEKQEVPLMSILRKYSRNA